MSDYAVLFRILSSGNSGRFWTALPGTAKSQTKESTLFPDIFANFSGF
jgi:hypothetical protein